jgi:hypothetical protein
MDDHSDTFGNYISFEPEHGEHDEADVDAVVSTCVVR